MRPLDATTFLSEDIPEEDASLSGKELVRAYWRTRALKAELTRKELYWANVCEALGEAYSDLERTTRELAEARAELAERVDAQGHELRSRSERIERLSQHLSERVEARSRELLAFASRGLEWRVVQIEPGTIFNGRTRVGEPIGEGGAGVVYHAVDDVLGADLAVKVLRRAYDPDATMRFLAEAGAASRAQHSAVVRPLHLDVSETGMPYIVMERVEGRSLHAQLATSGALPLKAVCRLGAVLANALASAHAAGLVHRDIKPGNVMLTRIAPGLRVLDFGISKALDGSVPRSITVTGRLMGTPAYMSPEQFLDPGSAGPAADVYSAGATLFEACTGRLPFLATTPVGLTTEHLGKTPPDLGTVLPDVPPELARLIAAALEKRAEDRPAATELAAALETLADSLGARAAHEEASAVLVVDGLAATL